jgi:hypothetical protein
MDRCYKRAERVNVYPTLAAMNRGQPPIKTVERVPYSRAGTDYYEVNGKVRPGWRDSSDPTADACVALEGPGSAITSTTGDPA